MGYKKGIFTTALECAMIRVQEQEEMKWMSHTKFCSTVIKLMHWDKLKLPQRKT